MGGTTASLPVLPFAGARPPTQHRTAVMSTGVFALLLATAFARTALGTPCGACGVPPCVCANHLSEGWVNHCHWEWVVNLATYGPCSNFALDCTDAVTIKADWQAHIGAPEEGSEAQMEAAIACFTEKCGRRLEDDMPVTSATSGTPLFP